MSATEKVVEMTDELEMKIIRWMMIDDQLTFFDWIRNHFLDYSQDEIKKALDSLKEKGLIYGGENILSCPYGLSDSNVKICDANGAVIEVNEEYVLKEVSKDLPNIRSIEGTAYSGRNDRIESIKKGDKVILQADYNSKFYSPVAVEVFNTDGESLGFLKEDYTYLSLNSIALALDHIDARVADVTPLSKRGENAKYALMDIELTLKGDINSFMETSECDMDISKSEQDQSIPTLNFTFEEGVHFKGLGYSIAIPDGFKFQQNMEGRDFVAWSPKELDSKDWNEADVAILSAVIDLETITQNPTMFFEAVKVPLTTLGKQTDCEVLFKPFSNGSVCGGYAIQKVSDSCMNYHCIIGENGNTHRFRIIINKAYSRRSVNNAVETWLRSMKCIITDEDNAKLDQMDVEARKKQSDDALAQCETFADIVNDFLGKFNKAW